MYRNCGNQKKVFSEPSTLWFGGKEDRIHRIELHVFMSFVVCHKCLSVSFVLIHHTIHSSIMIGSSSRCPTPLSGRGFDRFLFLDVGGNFCKDSFWLYWLKIYTKAGKAKQARLASNWAKHLCGLWHGYSNGLHLAFYSVQRNLCTSILYDRMRLGWDLLCVLPGSDVFCRKRGDIDVRWRIYGML